MSIDVNAYRDASRVFFENPMQQFIYHSSAKCSNCGEIPNNYRVLPVLIDLSRKTHKVAWKILHEKIHEVFKPRSREVQAQLENNPRLGLGELSNQLLDVKISECACKLFDRFRSHVRNVYEDYFISHAMKNIKQQLSEKGSFDLNIVLFMPGKLGAEVILLGLLMKEARGFPGRLNISLIEPEYKGIIYRGEADKEDFQLALTDFRKLLYAMSLQTGIEVSSIVCYENEQDYQSAVKHDSCLSYDFFLGSDLGKEKKPYFSSFMSLTINTCNKNGGDAIILYGDKRASQERVLLWHNGKERPID